MNFENRKFESTSVDLEFRKKMTTEVCKFLNQLTQKNPNDKKNEENREKIRDECRRVCEQLDDFFFRVGSQNSSSDR